jgi:hypothetical protein
MSKSHNDALHDMSQEGIDTTPLRRKKDVLEMTHQKPQLEMGCRTDCLSRSDENCSNCSIFF